MVKAGALRVKSRTPPDKVVTVPPSQAYLANGTPTGTPFGGGDIVTDHKYERIAYTTKRQAERYLSNPCSHYRLHTYYTGDPTERIYRRRGDPFCTDGSYFMYTGGHTAGPAIHALATTTALSALGISIDPPYDGDPQADMDSWFDKLQPDLTEISLPNFLLELDDIPRLWHEFKAALKTFRALSGPLSKSGKTARQIAGHNLAYNFGLKPLQGDISAMRSIFKNLLSKLDKFDENANKILESYKTIKNFRNIVSGTFNWQGSSFVPVHWTGSMIIKKSAAIKYRCLPREVSGPYRDVLLALTDALGFELNARILWDAIPFTFVLDWFFDVGSWLDAHKHDTLNLPIKHLDSYLQCTIEVDIETRFTQNPQNTCGDSGRAGWPAWKTHYKKFMRYPTKPSDSVFRGLGWSLPTLNQARLLVSLAATRA